MWTIGKVNDTLFIFNYTWFKSQGRLQDEEGENDYLNKVIRFIA